MPGAPRYSARELPPYRHLPGRTPHPSRDPDGHSFGREQPPFDLDETTWRGCEPYLYAIDLFNHGYYWESHEALEALWHGAGHSSAVGIFAQGVIQAAAALLKHSMGKADSARRLSEAAATKLRGGARVVLGADAHALADEVAAHLDGGRAAPPRIELSVED